MKYAGVADVTGGNTDFSYLWPITTPGVVLADPKLAQLLNGQRVVKLVAVPDKLVNLVVG